ncbi:MAG: NPCBM/NEW2 domain-containing protein, partial [Verrucomicrobia bacterium]|nr:NPCBM/NEW2 domain-containing protein [Verrucomicrobiota bacterium]
MAIRHIRHYLHYQFVLYPLPKPWDKASVRRACQKSNPSPANGHWYVRRCLVLWVLILQMAATLKAEEPSAVAGSLLERSRLNEQARTEAATRPLLQADIRCGPWHCIGPFKDAEYGVFSREFDAVFEPEKDVVALGDRLTELDKTYHSVPVAGVPEGSRRWTAYPDWADGYYNQLPSGPPPGRNEALYLYRTITRASAVEVKAWLVTLDAGKAWLNGKQVLDAPIRAGAGQRFLQVSFNLPLKAGENRLLLKITKCFQKNGFSFAIEGLHPIHPALNAQPAAREAAHLNPAPKPYASADWQQPRAGNMADPPWYARKQTWQESFLASRQAAAAGRPNGLPYTTRVLRQRDGPQHARLNVSGLQQLVLVCTIGGDNYDYDDTIWADPRLIAGDGKETWLTDLKPTQAKVGFMELFVNRNYAGKGLKIGSREFARGFWAHAPSLLVFDLAGKYEWFETWFGLDVLATNPGSSEFIIADSVAAASAPELDASLRALLNRDFPGPQPGQEMEHEFADGIWDGINSAEQAQTLCDRYATAILRTLALSNEPAKVLPPERNAMALETLRGLYHQAKRLDD